MGGSFERPLQERRQIRGQSDGSHHRRRNDEEEDIEESEKTSHERGWVLDDGRQHGDIGRRTVDLRMQVHLRGLSHKESWLVIVLVAQLFVCMTCATKIEKF